MVRVSESPVREEQQSWREDEQVIDEKMRIDQDCGGGQSGEAEGERRRKISRRPRPMTITAMELRM